MGDRVEIERHDQAEDAAAAHRAAQRLLDSEGEIRRRLDVVLDHAAGVTVAATPVEAFAAQQDMESAARHLVELVGEWT